MTEGVDYSWARPGGAALQAAGKTFAVRYLYPDGPGGKGLDASELADLRAHGLAVAVVFEASGTRVLSGRAAGHADAQTAQGQLDALGMGPLPVYFAVDFDATTGQQGPIDEYLRGAAEIIGLNRVGLYAGIGPIQRAQTNGTATWFWQTYAWSGGQVAAGIHLYQYRNGQNINGAVDFVRSLQADFGQSSVTTADVTATPITTDTETEDGMAKTTGIYYKRAADGAEVFALINPVSGFYSEWTLGPNADTGSYNNPIAAGFDTGSFVPVTESHAAALKAAAAAVHH